MAERPGKQDRKAMLRQVRDRQRAEARAAFPLSDEQFAAMFHWLDEQLPRQACDHSRRLTQTFLEDRRLAIEPVFAWLDEHGGYCDCEVLANVEQHWQECREE